MKDAIVRGLMEGSVGLFILALFMFMSIGMAEVGKEYPNLVIAFYVSFVFTIPITFNIRSFRRDEKMKEEKKLEESLSQVS